MTTANSYYTPCSCNIHRLLTSDDSFIYITGSQKQSDAAGKAYVAYNIRLGSMESKHRYSEFESLCKALTKLHPTVIVPPIPEKHSIMDYAALQTRVKDDIAMVEKRKRMLQTFLNRVAKHPVLNHDHVFHRFLESGVPWSDVLHSPPLSIMPKNTMQMIVNNDILAARGNSNHILSSHLIPIPSATYILNNPDPQFEESEQFTYRVANYMSNNLEKSQRKVIRRLELANDYAELGAVYNGFSLNEENEVANAIEKIGQAVDASYSNMGEMVTMLEGDFAEPIQEYAQFAHTIKQVLKFRHMKHAQVEMIETSLASKKEHMQELSDMEGEARRLEEAIAREHTIGQNAVNVDDINNGTVDADGNPISAPNGFDPVQSNPYARPPTSPTTSSPSARRASISSPARRRSRYAWSGPMQMVNAVSHTIQGLIDVDPVATRRNQIGKTKDAINILEEALDITQLDLEGISKDVQADLDRFQTEKISDLKDMLLAFAKAHIRYCQKNLESWQEVKDDIDKIPVQF
ncbi:hypothetical protein DM01DRAFT_1327116 [Hesseltinella vesiculosa]|uniref:PX domain-containing protein n=1 Tax=Hesseltinella vesiculosa TaxID=101127 RepID=A0A1X2G8B2_9FUNG|nr:hypothetical protein DM01DRAFT_1327116 [Hesseltinella vesiculosa]